MQKKILITAAVIIPLALILAILFLNKNNNNTDKEQLAKCLTEKGYTLAGTSWCPHCKEQKELFGDAFQYINYHDCDEEANWCTEHNIEGYPSWVSPTGAISTGVKSISALHTIADC